MSQRSPLERLGHVPGANFDADSDHLAMLLATVLENDDFEYNSANDSVEPKSASDFLKRIEEYSSDVPDKEAKLTLVRNKVLDKMKRTLRRERSFSNGGSVCSMSSRSSSRTRQRSETEEPDNVKTPKQRCPDRKSVPQASKLPGPLSTAK